MFASYQVNMSFIRIVEALGNSFFELGQDFIMPGHVCRQNTPENIKKFNYLDSIL